MKRRFYAPDAGAWLYAVVLVLALIWSGVANAAPTAYCNPQKSKPCGQGCIPLAKTCRKSWTTAVSGERPESAKIGYEKPKFVTEVPKSGTTAP